MDTNKLLGALLILTGVSDIVFARFLGSLTPTTRIVFHVFGLVFVALGAALALGFVRIV